MTNNDDFALREELRRLEAEKDRLEHDVVAPSWERERIVALERRQVLILEALARVEHRLDAYDAMCLTARMHDQVFLTAGEVKALSTAFDIRVGALDAKVKAIEDRLADDGR